MKIVALLTSYFLLCGVFGFYIFNLFLDINTVCVSGIGSSMIKNASAIQRISLKHILGDDVSLDALDLVNKLLIFNPVKRLNAEQALEHSYVSKFHETSEEIVMNSSVITPLNDDIRLSIDDYRNKLYELISSHNHNNQTRFVRNLKNSKTLQPIVQHEIKKRVTKEDPFAKHHCHFKEKTWQIQSEPKLGQQKIKTTNNTKSDSKISKQTISFPLEQNTFKCCRKSLNSSETISKDAAHTRKKMNSKSNIYVSFNSYNPSHGIITQSALMELRAAGIR